MRMVFTALSIAALALPGAVQARPAAAVAASDASGGVTVERLSGNVVLLRGTGPIGTSEADAAMAKAKRARALILDLRGDTDCGEAGYRQLLGHLSGRPLYVLVGSSRPAGAEAVLAALQMQKRAVIIGEAARGGTGVAPDVRTRADDALEIALGRARR